MSGFMGSLDATVPASRSLISLQDKLGDLEVLVLVASFLQQPAPLAVEVGLRAWRASEAKQCCRTP